eukprot:1160151-Pelagomonas_calceolata.AAC.10
MKGELRATKTKVEPQRVVCHTYKRAPRPLSSSPSSSPPQNPQGMHRNPVDGIQEALDAQQRLVADKRADPI